MKKFKSHSNLRGVPDLVNLSENRLHDMDEVGVGGEVDDVEQPLQLLQADGDGGAGHEAHNRRMREELDHEAQAQQPERRLEHPREERRREC